MLLRTTYIRMLKFLHYYKETNIYALTQEKKWIIILNVAMQNKRINYILLISF